MFIIFHNKLIITLIVMLTIPFGVSLADAISLQEAREEALRANLDVKIAGENVLKAKSQRKESFTEFFPTLSLHGSGSHANKKAAVKIDRGEFGAFSFGAIPQQDVESDRGRKDNLLIGVQLEQPVFTGGRYYFSYQQSKEYEKEAALNKQQTVLDILLSVEQAYLSLLQAGDNLKLAEQHEKTLKAHLADMDLRYKKGVAALNDVLKVRVEASRAKKEVIEADSALVVARGQLNVILNRPFDKDINTIPIEKIPPVTITFDDAKKLAIEQNPSLKSGQAQRQEVLYSRRVAEAEYYPNFSFVTEYHRQTKQPVNPDDNWSVMLNMDWPLWQWGRSVHKVKAAKAVERLSENKVTSLANQIIADVWRSWLQIQVWDKQIDVARDVVEQAKENLRITEFGFTKGVKTSTDVLDAEELLSKSRLEYIEAKYNDLFSRALFWHAIGGRPKDNDLSGVGSGGLNNGFFKSE